MVTRWFADCLLKALLRENREQYVQLESKLRGEMDDLYKKYVKACETIKEFQQRCVLDCWLLFIVVGLIELSVQWFYPHNSTETDGNQGVSSAGIEPTSQIIWPACLNQCECGADVNMIILKN
jgi:hypothetical protein